MHENQERFKAKVESHWPGKNKYGDYYRINWQEFINSQVKGDNSGAELIDNPMIDDIIHKIEDLKNKFIIFQNKLSPTQRGCFLAYMQRIYSDTLKILYKEQC